MKEENHFIDKSGWLRAAILGANDGILSTSSIIVGVAAAQASRESIVLAALAGAIAGAMSMAAGEYVSVSAQSDIEKSDLKRERRELEETPEEELIELAGIYEDRGLDKNLALEVATALTKHNALEAHARDELGINEFSEAKPLPAAFASFLAFLLGAALPFLVAIFAPMGNMIYFQYAVSILSLMILGGIAARSGGSNIIKAVVRICFWGTLAMVMAGFVGRLFGVNLV